MVAEAYTQRVQRIFMLRKRQRSDMIVKFEESNSLRPSAIVATTNSYVVSEATSNSVFCITVQGDVLWDVRTAGGLDFFDPCALAFSNGRVFVADAGNDRIVVLSALTGAVRAVIQPKGPYAFACPTGVAVDAVGHIVVSDSTNHRIVVLSCDGSTVLRVLGSPSVLCGPRSVAVDDYGNILVADSGNSRIATFSPTGGMEYNPLPSEPYFIVLDINGEVVVGGGDPGLSTFLLSLAPSESSAMVEV